MIAGLPADLRIPVYPQYCIVHRNFHAQVTKRATCYTSRHSFATHLLEAGYDHSHYSGINGSERCKRTMIYTHVLNKSGHGVKSPVDGLQATLLCRSI